MINKIYKVLLIFVVMVFCSVAYAEDLWMVSITGNLYQRNGQVVVQVLERGFADIRKATINNPDGGARIPLTYIDKEMYKNSQGVWVGNYAYYYTGVAYDPNMLFDREIIAEARNVNKAWLTGGYGFYRDPLTPLPLSPVR